MQVNANQASLLSAHSAYVSCLKNRVDEWVSMEPAMRQEQWSRGETEFCVNEKKAYLNVMERQSPIEYKNVIRLEESNY